MKEGEGGYRNSFSRRPSHRLGCHAQIFFLRLILGTQRASKRKPKLADFRGIFGSRSSLASYALNNDQAIRPAALVWPQYRGRVALGGLKRANRVALPDLDIHAPWSRPRRPHRGAGAAPGPADCRQAARPLCTLPKVCWRSGLAVRSRLSDGRLPPRSGRRSGECCSTESAPKPSFAATLVSPLSRMDNRPTRARVSRTAWLNSHLSRLSFRAFHLSGLWRP